MFPRKSNISSAEEKIPSKKNWRKRKFPQSKFPFRPEYGIRNSVKNGREISVPSGKRNSAEKIPRNSVFKNQTEFRIPYSVFPRKTERKFRGNSVFRQSNSAGNGNGIFDGIPRKYGNGNSVETLVLHKVLLTFARKSF